MAQKILKAFMITLVLIGIALTVLNFTPKLYAPTYYGTMTILTQDNIWDYYEEYGIDGLYDRHITGNIYCVDTHFDCCVHIVY